MGITLASNFDVNAALPLDSRMIVADLTARDAIAAGRRFQGMCVYVVADTLTYQLKGGITNIDWVEFGSGIAAATFVEKFSGDGGTLLFTLANDPLAIENTQVYIDGVYQQKTTSYILNTTDVEFVEAPPIGVDNIEVMYTTPTGALVIPDNYITSTHIIDGAITTDKILDANVTDAKIVSMDAAKLTGTVPVGTIAANSIDGSKLIAESVTSNEIAPGAVGTSEIANDNVTEIKIQKLFTSNAITTFSTASTSFVDVTNGSFTITRLSASKVLVFKLMAPLSSSLSYVSGVNFDIQLVRGATVVGIHRVNFTSGIDIYLPLSQFVWYEDSGTTGSATYKLQMRDNLGVGVTITNFRFNWHYL